MMNIVNWNSDGIIFETKWDNKYATVWPVDNGYYYNVQIGSQHYSASRKTSREAIEACEYLLLRDIFILTYTGKKFPFLCPKESDIDIIDIAHALAGINRFCSHTKTRYNVAHHSVLVSYICPVEFSLWGLLHDSSEAYLNDISTPLKNLLPEYKAIEKNLMNRICRKYGLFINEPPEVKHADMVVTATEFRDLMGHEKWSKDNNISCLDRKIVPKTDAESEYAFIRRFDELIVRNK